VTTTATGARIVWPRAVFSFVVGGVLTALLLGVPTDVIPNGFFSRMTPVEAYAVPVLVATSVLSGLLLATWLGMEATSCPVRTSRSAGTAGGVLAWLAIGCPVCNKLVLLALGTSGALTWFAHLQPWLAAASVALLAGSLAWRIRALTGPPRPMADGAGAA
jgi:hypothetical protein